MTISQDPVKRIIDQVARQVPYSLLDQESLSTLFRDSFLVRYEPGELILRADELPQYLSLVISGKVRLLGNSPKTREPITLDKRGSGQLMGWASLLRGSPCEWVIASEQSVILNIRSDAFLKSFQISPKFHNFFGTLDNVHETFLIESSLVSSAFNLEEGWESNLLDRLNTASVVSLNPGDTLPEFSDIENNSNWHLSSSDVPGYPVGFTFQQGSSVPERDGFKLPLRFISFRKAHKLGGHVSGPEPLTPSDLKPKSELPGANLHDLGILEDDLLSDDQRYPFVQGKGRIKSSLAVIEMVCLQQSAPFRRDIIEKLLEEQFRRGKVLSIELLSKLIELLGLKCQLGSVDIKYITSIEGPAVFLYNDVPVVLYAFVGQVVILGHPYHGILRIPISEITEKLGSSLSFSLPRRVGSTPTSRFGWNWFTPLILKYKKSLVLVFVASLLAQLLGLAIPLLIQQIIDKVLSQGNLSSLNVLGTVMITFALFQGLLMALRTYIFVDTTDRMDLSLGSAVIDRLLALPLAFFEKRPVGELSQRIGELNTIRGFLTGTALVSVLNIVFAVLYLVVMVIYSPLLTAVSLSTLPLYFLLVFGVAPIYKLLLRKRAVAQAKTQSHLIEVLGGIQTVKAQHFELTARWKWQDRYREFVNQGFRSAVLGATSGEIGKFLNQFSGLLVLWVGMWLVLQGELTLGMLIAFRIISSNVTGPLLQLSGLYQGFQKVQISMERLSDIIDQNPELSSSDEVGQIPLPPITGHIRYEDVTFRFGDKGPNQVEKVSLSIDPGSFVGVVGQSGSGKSTLMKLLPRLYNVDAGRVFIDDYDISKVNLSSLRRQIGIVPQDSLLFEGTIAENISMNDPQATTESIIEAAKIACAHDFIMSLGQGYATPLSERGSNLSGGQRQRIAIARTVLSNPRLLVMDEATSALDYNTERQLCLNLQDWSSDRTVLFITHRLSSIRNSDQILVMDAGRLVEQGTHDELLKNKQMYAALYNQQGDI